MIEICHVAREAWADTVRSLRDDGFTMLVDLTAVDYLTHGGRTLPDDVTPERYEVVTGLLNLNDRLRIRLRTQVPESDPTIASLFPVHPGAEALFVEAGAEPDAFRFTATPGLDWRPEVP